MTLKRWFAVLTLASVATAHASAQTLTVGANVNVSRRSGNESETSIVINKANPQQLLLVSNWDGASGMFGAVSTNGGTTWTTRSIATGSDGLASSCCDPWLGSDSFGNIYMSYLNSNATQTVIGRSTNGGATFTQVGTLGTGNGVDHPELAVGPGATAGQQQISVTYAAFGTVNGVASGVHAIAATSTGLGNTSAFSTPQRVATGGNFGDIAVGNGGRTLVTFMASSGGIGPSNLPIHYDSDGTGAATFALANNSISTQVGGFRPIPAQPNRTIDTQVKLAFDYSGGTFNNRAYMLYTQAANTSTNDTNIVIRRSTDNGTTWSAELQLNTDGTTRSQFFGRMAVDQVTGNIGAIWLDTRNDANNVRPELWGTVSTDGGVTWLPEVKISTNSWDGRQSNISNPNEMGDYISMDFHNNVMQVAWCAAANTNNDNPNGTTRLDIYTASVTFTPIPEPATLLLAAAAVPVWWRLRRKK